MPLIIPRKVIFSPATMDRMWEYVSKQIDYLLAESQELREVTLPEWTRLLKGIPKEQVKNFPFPNASNLVVQLIATRVEQLLARSMVMWGIDPLFTVTATGDLVGQESDEQAKMLEQFLGDMAIDPDELNLYQKEERFIHDGIAYGTSFMALPWQYITEAQCTSINGHTVGLNRTDEFKTLVKREGPAPENVPLYRMLVSNKVTEFEKARFIAREVPLTREAIEDRIAFGTWPKDLGEKVLASPDNHDSNINQIQSNANKGIQDTGNEYAAEYKVYECYFKFLHNNQTYAIVAHYHKGTDSHLSAVFNYFPKNAAPIEDLRFGFDTDSYRGYGFIEMLKGYQQEVSQLHNNRLDNEAIRNNVSFRINKGSELANTLKFYPGVQVPADEGEVEVLETNVNAVDNGQSEQTATAMTNERSGIDPAISGTGSGVVNAKRGIYSSQGTMAVLQQQNNRSGLRMMDVRMAHMRLGRKLIDMYAFLGAGTKIRRYGEQSEILRKALDSVRQGNLGLVLKPTNASLNVESDRQNSILLSQLQDKYIQTLNGLMGMMGQQQNDPAQTKFIQDLMFAEQSLTRHIFRVFGHQDVDKLVPFPEAVKNARYQQQQQQQQQPTGSPQAAQNVVPIGSAGGNVPVPTGNAGR